MVIVAEKFIQELATKSIPNLVLALGEDEYYQELLQTKLTERVFGQVSSEEQNVVIFQDKFAYAELEEAMHSTSFFATNNLLFLKHLKILQSGKNQDGAKQKEEQVRLLSLLQKIPAETTVVLVCDKIDKRSKLYTYINKMAVVVDCAPLKSYSLQPWLEQQAGFYGVKWEYSAIGLICEYMSQAEIVPLLLLKQEISKLAIFMGKSKVWTKEAVEVVFADLPEVSNYAVGNAITAGQKDKFLELLSTAQRKGDNFVMVTALIMHEIRRLLLVKNLMLMKKSKNDIVTTLKFHPYTVQLLMTGANKYSFDSLEEALRRLLQINREFRQGGRGFSAVEETILVLLTGKGEGYE